LSAKRIVVRPNLWESEKLGLVFLAASRSVETHWILRDLHFIVLGYFEISLNSTTRARVVEFSYYFDGF